MEIADPNVFRYADFRLTISFVISPKIYKRFMSRKCFRLEQ